ncbi:hypothetical protein D3C75_714410 [compost metagenome]
MDSSGLVKLYPLSEEKDMFSVPILKFRFPSHSLGRRSAWVIPTTTAEISTDRTRPPQSSRKEDSFLR